MNWKPQFPPGSLVRLKSGGATMTVGTHDPVLEAARCYWNADNGTHFSGLIPEVCLEWARSYSEIIAASEGQQASEGTSGDASKLQAEVDHAIKQAMEYCPDYPWQGGSISEAVWALGQKCHGVCMANDDLHEHRTALLAACKKALHIVEENNEEIVTMVGSFGLLADLKAAIAVAEGKSSEGQATNGDAP